MRSHYTFHSIDLHSYACETASTWRTPTVHCIPIFNTDLRIRISVHNKRSRVMSKVSPLRATKMKEVPTRTVYTTHNSKPMWKVKVVGLRVAVWGYSSMITKLAGELVANKEEINNQKNQINTLAHIVSSCCPYSQLSLKTFCLVWVQFYSL